MAHVHAKLMADYAKDAAETDKPWELWEVKHSAWFGWRQADNHPKWAENWDYRRKPRTININGYELDMDRFKDMADLLRRKGWNDLVDAMESLS